MKTGNSQRPRILLTDEVRRPVLAALEAQYDVQMVHPTDRDAFAEAIATANAIIVRSPLPDDAFDRAPNMLIAVRHGAGIDMIPLENAAQNGVTVSSVQGANSNSVAEFAVGQMIGLVRKLHVMDASMRRIGWSDARQLATAATEISDKTLGLVGVGAIGSRLASICADGFGMRVIGYRRNTSQIPHNVTPASLEEVFEQSDFVGIVCPLTDQTRGLVNRDLLERMKPEAVLMNLARGPIVQTEALIEILEQRKIAGAVLDVFDPEPLPDNSPLLEFDNVILSPHVSGISVESAIKLGFGCMAEIERVFQGTPPQVHFNSEIWERTLQRRNRVFA